jgi:UDPglucose 6-dehydrogenase
MRLTILGAGYVGLVTAAGLAARGHAVVCADTDAAKIDILRPGGCTVFEPELPELLEKSEITFTADCAAACADADAVMIAVGTPEKPNGSADLSQVRAALDTVIAAARADCTVVVKSTVPVGTGDRLERYAQKRGMNFALVSNPEFLSQGTAVRDMLFPGRIVVGTNAGRGKETCDAIYRQFDTRTLFVDRRSAEMIKYAANAFLALKISYINEIANLCEYAGADIDAVAAGIGADERIGDRFLRAGIGYGGSCFPKDTKALHWFGNINDCELKTVKAAIEVNAKQKLRLLRKAHEFYPSLEGLTVAILGLAFKPQTNDLREAPSLEYIPYLLEEGAHIKAWDYCAVENYRRIYPDAIRYADTIEEALQDADLCLILTEWRQVRDLPPQTFRLMRRPVILDGRNCFDLDTMRAFPYAYYSVGREMLGGFKAGSCLATKIERRRVEIARST